MEFEQIVKQLEWLDEEHRKDKATLTSLEKRLTALESTLSRLSKQLSGLSTASARLNQFDEFLAQQRLEMNQAIENIEKKHQRHEREAAKRHQIELDEFKKSLSQIHKEGLKERSGDESRSSQAITEFKQKVDNVIRDNEEIRRAHHAMEEGHRQDAKRMTDLQGEVTALRKHTDERREQVELNADRFRYLDTRMADLFAAEAERKQAQSDFIEQQAMAQVERERAWKDWQEKYDAFKKQAESLEANAQSIEETFRAAQKAREAFGELNQRMERRINEVTELQRLAEDRLRQEWVTFKSDDQKRWTTYKLLQDESMRELRADIDKLKERSTTLDDTTQTLQDQLHQTSNTTEQQLQELMNWAHDWLTAYERIMGHSRKPR